MGNIKWTGGAVAFGRNSKREQFLNRLYNLNFKRGGEVYEVRKFHGCNNRNSNSCYANNYLPRVILVKG